MKHLSVLSSLNKIDNALNASRDFRDTSTYNEYQSDKVPNIIFEDQTTDKNNTRKSSAKDPYEAFEDKTLFFLTKTNKFRRFCLRIITSSWFERISICVILMNCVTLGMYKPCEDNPCNNRRCIVTQYCDLAVYGFFVVELVIKLIALGFFGKSGYLSEAWNRLDLFIIVAGTIEYSIATENLSLTAIRTVRVLRPLRYVQNLVPRNF